MWIRATGSARTVSRWGGEHVGAAVDEVEVEVVAGEDAGEFEADVSDAEDRSCGCQGQGSRSIWTVPPQHCTPLRARSMNSGSRAAVVIMSRARSMARLRCCRRRWSPGAGVGDDEFGAGVAGGVAADGGDGDEDAGFAVGAQVCDGGDPGGVRHCSASARVWWWGRPVR